MSSPAHSFQALVRLLRYAKGYRRRIVAATTCSVINKLFDIAPEILIGVAIDVVVKRRTNGLSGFFSSVTVFFLFSVNTAAPRIYSKSCDIGGTRR